MTTADHGITTASELRSQLCWGQGSAALAALLLLGTATLHWLAPSTGDQFGWRHVLALAAIAVQVQAAVCFLLLGEAIRSRQLEAAGVGSLLACWLVLLADLAVRPFMHFYLGLAAGAVCVLGAMALLGLLDWGLPPLGKVAGMLLLLAFLSAKVLATPPEVGIDLAVATLPVGLAIVGLVGFPLWLGVALLWERRSLGGTAAPLGAASLIVAAVQAGLLVSLGDQGMAAVKAAGSDDASYSLALKGALPLLTAVTAGIQGAFAALTSQLFRSVAPSARAIHEPNGH